MSFTSPQSKRVTRGTGIALALTLSLGVAACGTPALTGGQLPGIGDSVELNRELGAFSLSFQSEFQSLATKADIKQLKITLSGSSLGTPQTRTVTYPPTGSVSFINLKAGDVTLAVEALDAAGQVIGSVNKSGIEILAGQVTNVSVTLKLAPTPVDSGNGNVGVGIIIEDGDIITTPLPSPTPAPTPTPVPTQPPSSGGSLTGDFYVDANVSRTGSGSSSSPYKTIAEAVSRASAGQTIVVRPGTYRETVKIGKSITLLGEPGAVIKGSDVWTGWTKEGNYWTKPYSLSWFQHGEGSARARLADQVFINGQAQYQETSQGAVSAGKFYVGNGKLYIGTDPSGKTVEVTTRERWVMGQNGASNVTVKGFTMAHGAIYAQRGGMWDGGGSGWLIEGNDMSYAHGAGVQINGNNAILRNNKIHHNGQIGIVTSYETSQKPQNQTVEGNEIYNNNTEAFNAGWEAGGTKFSRTTGLKIRNNTVYENNGPGLWFDIDVYDTTISGNRVHHNVDKGIVYELSYNALIENNYVWENGYGYDVWVWGAGILVQNSSGVTVRNNVVAWNADGIGVVQQQRDPWTDVKNNNVSNNVIAGKNTLLGWVSDTSNKTLFDSGSNNRGSSNKYYNAGGANWEWSGWKGNINDFNATPGEEGGAMISQSTLNSTLNQAGMPTSPSR